MRRRDFLRGAVAVAAAGAMDGCATAECGAAKASGQAAGALDPYAIGVICDIHTGMPWSKQQYRTGREYPWIPAMQKALESLTEDTAAIPGIMIREKGSQILVPVE